MNRLKQEHDYWEKNSQDPNVLDKYISNIETSIPKFEGRTLEVGCGIGRLMRPGYCGIDISEGMLSIAGKKHPDCEFKLTDGRTIPYPDYYFDNVYCVLLFQHLPFEGVKSYIGEVDRVLRRRGRFVFQYIPGTEDEPFSKHHQRKDLIPLLNNFGGEVIEQKYHPMWEWMFLSKK